MNTARLCAQVRMAGRDRVFALDRGTSIATPIAPGGRHPRFFTDQPVTTEPVQAGGFTGRVATGASCNAAWIRIAPHCHGTHCEGPGHLMADAHPVQQTAPQGLLRARLVSVTPGVCDEPAPPGAGPDLIDSSALAGLADVDALVLRTLPNDPAKLGRNYADPPAYPVLSCTAIDHLVALGILHLLLDTPSLDPADDGGALVNHRRFWGFTADRADPARAAATLTELIYVPNHLADGHYLLSLGLSSILGEATPAAPVLFSELDAAS